METKEKGKDNNPSNSYFDSRINWFKKMFKRSGKEKPPKENPPLSTDPLKELIDTVDKDQTGGSFSFIPEEISADFNRDIKEIIVLGFNDGITGTASKVYGPIATLDTLELYHRFLDTMNRKKTKLGDDVASQNAIYIQKKKELASQYAYNTLLQHHYRFNERGNTIGEFVLYLILFLLILLADIPIGVELMQTFFKPVPDANSFSHLFDFGRFIDVLQSNWEAVLTAIGVATGTIYIKIWYDEFVGGKYGHLVLSKKKFAELFQSAKNSLEEQGNKKETLYDEAAGLSESEKQEIVLHAKKVEKIKKWILAFTLLVLVAISVFRATGWQQTVGQGEIFEPPVPVLLVTMVALTLFFAVLSGICLSIALNSLTNYRRQRNSRRHTQLLEKELLNAGNTLSSLQHEKAKEEEINQEVNWKYWERNISEVFKAYYDMGYNQGRIQPGYFMREKDFLDRIIYARDEDTAFRITAYLTNQTSEQ